MTEDFTAWNFFALMFGDSRICNGRRIVGASVLYIV